jgi:hypothetical protein
VTLFPFLAVLVCTMGALILLLLVTTRQIRNQAAAQAVGAMLAEESAVPLVAADNPEEDPSPPALSAPSEDEIEPEEPASVSINRDEEERERRERHRLTLSEREREQEQLNTTWRQRLARLREEQEELTERLNGLRARIETDSTELDRLDAELGRIDELLAGADEQKQKLDVWEGELENNQQEIRGRLAEVTRQIETEKSQQRFRPRPLQIVAFDPSTGTERKPILIECRSDSLVFASEGVPITAVELSGFTPDYNPLKAGTDALVEYWDRQERLDPGRSAKPYVLLVVRPGGTVGFYVARKMLEKLDHDFGYELVGPNDDIEWPERDPEAARVCREAVDRMLSERERLMANLGGSRYPLAGTLRFAGRDGEFHLQEVDELRNTDAEGLYLGGKKWVPPKRGGGSAGMGHADSGTDGFGADANGREETRGRGDARGQPGVSRSYVDVQPGSDGEETPFRGGRRYEEQRRSHPPLDSPEVHPLLSPPGRSGLTESPGMNRETGSPRLQPAPESGGIEGSRPDSFHPDSSHPGSSHADSSFRTNRNGMRSDESRRILNPSSPTGQRSASEPTSSNEPGDADDLSRPDWSSTNRPPSTQPSSSGGEDSNGADRPPQQLRPARSSATGQQSPSSGTFGRRSENDDPARRWNDANRNGVIGIEREVTVHVWADRVNVGDERELEISPDLTREELQQQFAIALRGQVRDWGTAPESFFWRPALKFVIHPGGNRHYSRLNQLADQWELRKRVEYDLQ